MRWENCWLLKENSAVTIWWLLYSERVLNAEDDWEMPVHYQVLLLDDRGMPEHYQVLLLDDWGMLVL